MAKAGNIVSLKYDLKSGAVKCKSAFTIGFLCNIANSYRYNSNLSEVVKLSFAQAGQAYVSTLAKYVVVQQIARTSLLEPLNNLFFPGSDKNKALSLIDYPLTVITLSIPSIVSAFQKHISYGQLMKNTIVLAGSVAGGMIGAKIGGYIGFKVLWFFGKPIGALIGGIIGQKKGLELAKNKADSLREDDIVIFSYLYYAYIETLTIDYMLDETEIEKLAKILSEVQSEDLLLLNKQFIKNDYSEKVIVKFLDKKFKRVVSSRPKVYEDEVIEAMATLAIAQN